MSLAALEAALAATPGDPLVLAAYADCLSDAGDPRGEFVQLQAALDDPGVVGRRAIEREVRRLWRLHSDAWVTGLARRVGRVGFYRLDGAVPLARLNTLTPAVVADLSASPVWWLLRGVRADALGLGFDPATDFIPVCTALSRSRVRTLALHHCPFGDDGVDALVSTGLLGRLSALTLIHCSVTDSGAEALAAHPLTPELRPLDLDWNHLSPVGHAALAAVGVHVSDRQYFMPGGWDYDPPAFPDDR